MDKRQWALIGLVAALIVGFWALDLGRWLSFDYIKAQQQVLQARVAAAPLAAALAYLLVYLAVAALSLPGAAVLTLLGGALFGFWQGLALASVASTAGATLAFLIARTALRESVQRRFGARLAAIDAGLAREGAFYLFTLRLVPLFPFFVVNLLMGLSALRTGVFALVSQLGMLPGTAVYVNAGTQLAALDSPAGILSPGLLLSFALLGVFPLLAKRLLDALNARRVYRGWHKPARFDRNLIVIGAGAGGLVTAYIGAAVRAEVTLIEKHRMGGDCLNYGCVPSKALLRSAKFVHQIARHREFGQADARVELDFGATMARVAEVVAAVAPHDSVERYRGLGVEVLQGEATLVSPWEVDVDGRRLSARSIVLALGAAPAVPPIPGIEQTGYHTSDTIWSLRERPARLVVLGGGPIGSELTQAFVRLGSAVTQVEMLPRLMMREDQDVSAAVQARFEAEGVRVLTATRALAAEWRDGQRQLICERDGERLALPFDALLVAVGRAPRTAGSGLEAVGVALGERGTIAVDRYLRSNFPNIYAVGDCAGPYQFTHTAAHQAWHAAVNALFGGLKRFAADYRVIPWATFTDPEVARVGLNEREAREQGVAYEVSRYGIDDLDRAIADGEAHGWVKVLTVPGKDRILGVTIVGEHAGDLIAEYVLAMKHGLGLNKILGTVHIYPTLAEANKYAAGEWKRAHAPERALRWVARFHRWMRG